MTQKQIFDEQATAQWEFEQYINQQALLIAVDNDANYSINCQTKDFLPGEDNSDRLILNQAVSELPIREPIKHLLIGSPKAVTSTQRYLHQLGYAQMGDWSALLPNPENPLEVMSILVKQILVE